MTYTYLHHMQASQTIIILYAQFNLLFTCTEVLQNPNDVLLQSLTLASMPTIGRRICVHTVVENFDVEAQNVHSCYCT